MIIAAVVAVLIALFQYGYIGKNKSTKKKPWFALLRFLTVFCVLLILIAPRFESKTYQELLPQLVIMVDNSKSIAHLESSIALKSDLQLLLNDKGINERFEVQSFQFDKDVQPLDSLQFDKFDTDLNKAISQPQEIFKNRNKAIVLLTDGNQTTGNSYAYSKIDNKTKVFPIIYGDTTQYPDLYISNINVNRYTYLNNEFPVEVFINYLGNEKATRLLTITQGGKTLYKKTFTFDIGQKSAIANFNLGSTTIGTMSLQATIEPLNAEKNTANNTRNFAVQVIDQQTNVLILYDYLHPDIGALKKAISSNQQRQVTIKNTTDAYDLNEYNLVVMYGVSTAFAKAYTQKELLGKNTWVIVGPDPDLSYLNKINTAINIDLNREYDEAQPILNDAYASFNLQSLNFEDYPPVKVPFGDIKFNTNIDVLFYKQIGAIKTKQPIWFTYENGEEKHAITLASGLWRWRAQSFLNNKDFKNFDDLVNSQIQYLASNKKRDRLEVIFDPFYDQNRPIEINAQYLNKNYEFDTNGLLNISVINKNTGEKFDRPFVLQNNAYIVDLSGIVAGDYTFIVIEENEKLTSKGAISILEYDIEKQQSNASDTGMKNLVGKENVLYQGNIKTLINKLNNEPLLQTVERENIEQTSFIDLQYLLGLILLLLGIEWFLRKYNGLI
jgi:hypothetical protein